MTILTKYFAKEFTRLFFLCLCTFVLMYLLVDFIERSNTFLRHEAAPADVLMYFVYKIPMIMFQTIPAAVLLSTVLTLVIKAKNMEIVAMMASGISIFTIAAPFLIISAIISASAFAINEYVVPYSNAKVTYIEQVNIKGKEATVGFKIKQAWYRSKDGIYDIDTYYPPKKMMKGVKIYFMDNKFKLVRRIDAERAQWMNNGWVFYNGTDRYFKDAVETFQQPFEAMPIPLPETPDDFAVAEKPTDEMSFRELNRYIDKVKLENVDVRKYRVDLYGKISFSLVSLVMSLLGIPFSLRTDRQGGLAAGVGLSLVISVAYWLVMSAFLSLGHSGRLPPFFSACGSHVIFIAVGMGMLAKATK